MRRLCTLLISILLALGLQFPPVQAFTTDGQEDICATAAVIFCDNFETGSLGSHYKMGGWVQGVGGEDTTTIVTTEHFDGSRSLQFAYDANAGSGFLESGIGAHSDLYIRWYTKHSSNYVISGTATKHAEWRDQAGMTTMLFGGTCNGCTGNTGWDEIVYGIGNSSSNSGILTPAPVILQAAGVWVCYEFHTKMQSSQFATDGLIEGWIDGTQYWNYPNINVSAFSGGTPSMTAAFFGGYWNCHSGDLNTGGGAHQPCSQNGDPYNTHPAMQRWNDNIVISTQRIRCLTGGGGGGGDVTPPAPPTGVQIH